MGYTIHYSPESNKRYPIDRRTKKLTRIITLCVVATALFFAVRYRTELVQSLLPGDPEVISVALHDLVMNIREGNASEAITTFCREIIHHAAG